MNRLTWISVSALSSIPEFKRPESLQPILTHLPAPQEPKQEEILEFADLLREEFPEDEAFAPVLKEQASESPQPEILISEAQPEPPNQTNDFHGSWFLRHLNTGVAIRLSDHSLMIGASPVCDYVIEFDPSISRRHVKITVKHGKVEVQDLGSTNQSYINYQPLEKPTFLEEEQILRLGFNQVFEVRFYEAEQEETL